MNTSVNLGQIFVCNGMGLILSIVMLWNTNWKINATQKENKYIMLLLWCSVISTIMDPLVFYFDGAEGMLPHYIILLGNFIVFFTTLMVGPLWVCIISHHVAGKIDKIQKYLCLVAVVVSLTLLFVNLFVPIVYEVTVDNHYCRGDIYYVFSIIELLFILDGLAYYWKAKKSGGSLKFFPAFRFIVPALVGLIIQSMFFGLSTLWPFISISITVLVHSLQNENIYRDHLTGLYNHFYLENLKTSINIRSLNITAMMLDMNGFKQINDRYGHTEGDKALIKMGEILQEVVGTLGVAIRYAGDEFVVLLNTDNEQVVFQCMKGIHKATEKYNLDNPVGYKLSASIGYSIFDLKLNTIDEILHVIDQKMYEAKSKYYASNPELNRRKNR